LEKEKINVNVKKLTFTFSLKIKHASIVHKSKLKRIVLDNVNSHSGLAENLSFTPCGPL